MEGFCCGSIQNLQHSQIKGKANKKEKKKKEKERAKRETGINDR
jgi:hypothetical protein